MVQLVLTLVVLRITNVIALLGGKVRSTELEAHKTRKHAKTTKNTSTHPQQPGKDCDEPVNECASNPCQNDGSCVDLHASFKCECASGYSGDTCETSLAV